jgi:hypothetical protein
MEENELRQLAEGARRELPELIPDEDERRRADGDLARALNEPPASAKPALMEALNSHEGIRRWVAADTDRIVYPGGDPTGSGFGVLYACPRKDYTVVRETLVDGDLLCPNDGTVLYRYNG